MTWRSQRLSIVVGIQSVVVYAAGDLPVPGWQYGEEDKCGHVVLTQTEIKTRRPKFESAGTETLANPWGR